MSDHRDISPPSLGLDDDLFGDDPPFAFEQFSPALSVLSRRTTRSNTVRSPVQRMQTSEAATSSVGVSAGAQFDQEMLEIDRFLEDLAAGNIANDTHTSPEVIQNPLARPASNPSLIWPEQSPSTISQIHSIFGKPQVTQTPFPLRANNPPVPPNRAQPLYDRRFVNRPPHQLAGHAYSPASQFGIASVHPPQQINMIHPAANQMYTGPLHFSQGYAGPYAYVQPMISRPEPLTLRDRDTQNRPGGKRKRPPAQAEPRVKKRGPHNVFKRPSPTTAARMERQQKRRNAARSNGKRLNSIHDFVMEVTPSPERPKPLPISIHPVPGQIVVQKESRLVTYSSSEDGSPSLPIQRLSSSATTELPTPVAPLEDELFESPLS